MQRHSVVVPADVRAGMIFPWTRKRVLILFCVVFFFFFSHHFQTRVMMFEGKANEGSPKPVGPPPERDIASLP